MLKFLSRSPFALLGGIGLFSLVSDFLTLQEDIQNWIAAWEAVTRPIWEFMLGWLFKYLNIPFSDWIKDYFTMGFITLGGAIRLSLSDEVFIEEIRDLGNAWSVPFNFLLWPIAVGWALWEAALGNGDEAHMLFFEAFVYAAVLVAINYGLVLSG